MPRATARSAFSPTIASAPRLSIPAACGRRRFEEQLGWLSEHSNVLTPGQFDAIMSGESRCPGNAVLITIDDGHESVADMPWPALDRRGSEGGAVRLSRAWSGAARERTAGVW